MLRFALGGILLSASMHSAALSLGGHNGQAIIGRSLDISVRSTASVEELAASGCLEADVTYGDVRVAPSAVSLALLEASGGSLIRIRASIPVNEPVVAVLLRAGCSGDIFSRRYVLLADMEPTPAAAPPASQLPLVVPSAPAAPLPSASSSGVVTPPEPRASTLPAAPPVGGPTVPPRTAPAPAATAAAPARPPAAAPAPRPAPVPAPAPAPRAAPPAPAPAPAPARVPVPAPAPAPAPRAAAPAPALAPAPAPATVPAPGAATRPQAQAAPAAPPAPASTGPRLQLDPVDLNPQAAPSLKSSLELQSIPTESEQARRAAQALWAALNAPPEQVLQDAQKLATLEQEVQGLRAEEERLKASIETLNRQLQEAQASRAPMWLTLALGLALLLALAALLWLLRERKRAASDVSVAQPWWQSSQQIDEPGPGQALSAMAQAESGWSAPMPPHPVTPSEDSGVEVSEASESSFALLHDESPVDVEALHDLNQHCEFFESLGQRMDAVAVLEEFVSRHPSASELPYLWLLRLNDEQGLPERVDHWQSRYERVYGVGSPQPSDYGRTGQGLWGQQRFLDALQALWPGPQAEKLLRETLAASPAASLLDRRSLSAYQDLLMLMSVLQALPAVPAATRLDAAASSARSAAPRETQDGLSWNSPVPVSSAGLVARAELVRPPAPVPSPPPMDVDLPIEVPDFVDPPPVAENAPPPEPERRDLPMLDFDLFELEPRPGEVGKTTDKPVLDDGQDGKGRPGGA